MDNLIKRKEIKILESRKEPWSDMFVFIIEESTTTERIDIMHEYKYHKAIDAKVMTEFEVTVLVDFKVENKFVKIYISEVEKIMPVTNISYEKELKEIIAKKLEIQDIK